VAGATTDVVSVEGGVTISPKTQSQLCKILITSHFDIAVRMHTGNVHGGQEWQRDRNDEKQNKSRKEEENGG